MSSSVSLRITAKPTETQTQQQADTRLANIFAQFADKDIAEALAYDVWNYTDIFVGLAVEKVVTPEEATPARVVHIEPTEAQWVTIDEITGGHDPFIKPVGNGALRLQHIIDDKSVRLYVIQADGSYAYEILQGFGEGWSESLNADGTAVESEHDESTCIEGEPCDECKAAGSDSCDLTVG